MRIKKLIPIIMVIVLIGCTSVHVYKYSSHELHMLELTAFEIDKMTNVSARKYYEVYMSLGEAYYQFHAFEKSLESLKKGLRLNSRDYTHQLLAAQIEFELNQVNFSYFRILQVIKNAESGKIKKEARKLLSKIEKLNIQLDFKEIPEMYDKTIYIVPIGLVDLIFLTALKNRIEDEYKITITILNDIMVPSREKIIDKHSSYYKSVVDRFIEKEGKDVYNAIITKINAEKNIISQDLIEKEFVYYLFLQQENGQQLWEDTMDRIHDQFNAEVLCYQLSAEYNENVNEENCQGVLGVTAYDIYAKDYNFLFGWKSRNKSAVMSYNRFISDQAPITKQIKRVVMQGLSSAGHLIGIPRCSIDTCARAYPNSLSEHDAKEDILCFECRNNLIKLYNKMKP